MPSRDRSSRRGARSAESSSRITLLSAGALLFVAAQTGFVDGPRVLSNMALDRWVPSRFVSLSERLVTRERSCIGRNLRRLRGPRDGRGGAYPGSPLQHQRVPYLLPLPTLDVPGRDPPEAGRQAVERGTLHQHAGIPRHRIAARRHGGRRNSWRAGGRRCSPRGFSASPVPRSAATTPVRR